MHENIEHTVFESLLATLSQRQGKITWKKYENNSKLQTRSMIKKYSGLCEMHYYKYAAAYIKEVIQQLDGCSIQEFWGIVYGFAGVLSMHSKSPIFIGNLSENLDIIGIFDRLTEETLHLSNLEKEQKNIYVQKAIIYIHNNLDKPLKIGIIAKELYVSPNYLGKIFYDETGERLTEFINKSKIEQAKILLLNPKYTILDVATMVGIPDQRYFSKLFKRINGLTPSEFSKLNVPTAFSIKS